MSTKPEVQIYNASIVGGRLVGVVRKHPVLGEGERVVMTSPIVAHHSTRKVETLNTMYIVKGWGK